MASSFRARVLAVVRRAIPSEVPVLAKLSPDVTDIDEVARAARARRQRRATAQPSGSANAGRITTQAIRRADIAVIVALFLLSAALNYSMHYNYPLPMHSDEYDHLVSLELGGAPNAAINLIECRGADWRVLAWAERAHLDSTLDEPPL